MVVQRVNVNPIALSVVSLTLPVVERSSKGVNDDIYR